MSFTVGVVLHHHRAEVLGLARRVVGWVERRGGEVLLPESDAALAEVPELGCDERTFGSGLAMCVSLGGDGTMLRATHLVAGHSVPVLGINAGELGYLTEVEPADLEPALEEWRRGELATQERMLLEVLVANDHESGGDAAEVHLALNEVVMVSSANTRAIDVDAAIAGRHFTTYLADGVIVSTPTGSTAYSLSAGGPIVDPEFDALLLSAVAPHKVFDRSLVLAPTTEVALRVAGYRPATVAVDGRELGELAPGASIVCRASDRRARFLVRGDRDFHTILKEKFGLSEP